MHKLFSIPKANMEAFKKEMDRISRKTGKLIKWLPIRETVKNNITYIDVRVFSEAPPEYQGWKFVAEIFRNKDHNIITMAKQDIETDPAWHDVHITSRCDHCKKNRRRVKAYVIEKDGVRKIIGSTCVKDYFGGFDPAKVAYYFQFLRNIPDIVNKHNNDPRKRIDNTTYFDFQRYIEYAIMSYFAQGQHYYPSRPYNMLKTLGNVDIDGPFVYIGGFRKDEYTREVIEFARHVVAECVRMEYTKNRQIDNILAALKDGVVRDKVFSRVAFNLYPFLRFVNEQFEDHPYIRKLREETRKAFAAGGQQNGIIKTHWGEEGKEYTRKLKVINKWLSRYNIPCVSFVVEEDGQNYHLISFFPKRRKEWNMLEKGKIIEADFRVSSHTEFHKRSGEIIKDTVISIRSWK